MRAAHAGDAEMLSVLLEKGASIGLTDSNGNVALSYAAMGGCPDTLMKLLGAPGGEDYLDHKNNEQCTPLLLAAKHGHLDNLRKLLESGASVTAVDADGLSALSMVCMKMWRDSGNSAHVRSQHC